MNYRIKGRLAPMTAKETTQCQITIPVSWVTTAKPEVGSPLLSNISPRSLLGKLSENLVEPPQSPLGDPDEASKNPSESKFPHRVSRTVVPRMATLREQIMLQFLTTHTNSLSLFPQKGKRAVRPIAHSKFTGAV